MRTIKIIMSICVVAILLAAVTATASAFQPVWQECTIATKGSFENSTCTKEKTSGGHAWLEVYETRSVKSSEKALSISDTKAKGGALKVECTATAEGWIGRESQGAITAVALSKCTRVSGSECEGSPTVKAIDLPWSTTLEEGIKDKLKAGGKGPGFKIECATKRIDECFGTIATTMKNNGELGVAEAEFPSESLDECTSGAAKSGEIKGTFALKATESTVGAIRVVTPANAGKFKIKQSAKEGEIMSNGEMIEVEIENTTGAAVTPLLLSLREDPLAGRFRTMIAERTVCEQQYAANATCKYKLTFVGAGFTTQTVLIFDDTGRYTAHVVLGS